MLQYNHRNTTTYRAVYFRTPNYADVRGIVQCNDKEPPSFTVRINCLATKALRVILLLEAAAGGSSHFMHEGVALNHRCKHQIDVPALSINLAQAFTPLGILFTRIVAHNCWV